MNQPVSPILDYASPRPRVKIRLPASSILRCDAGPGWCRVEETLSGKGQAVAALCFTAFVLWWVVATPFALVQVTGDALGVCGVEAMLLIGLSLLVVRNTWRRTLLGVADGGVTVTFSAPLTRARRYAWAVGMVQRIDVVATEGRSLLGELRVIPDAGAEVHLFTDHRMADLHEIATMLEETIRHYTPPPPTVSASGALDQSPIRSAQPTR